MNRTVLVTLHLGMAALFLPFLMIIPLSGGLHLLGMNGELEKTEAFQVPGAVPAEGQEQFFRDQFKAQNLNFDFEMMRVNGKDYTFRPSTRTHYMATQTDGYVVFFKLKPDWYRRLLELHKGHGPRLIQWLQVAFALAVILVSISGVYLAVTVPKYRKVLIAGFSAGILVLLLGLI